MIKGTFKTILCSNKDLSFETKLGVLLNQRTQPPVPLLFEREGGIKGG